MSSSCGQAGAWHPADAADCVECVTLRLIEQISASYAHWHSDRHRVQGRVLMLVAGSNVRRLLLTSRLIGRRWPDAPQLFGMPIVLGVDADTWELVEVIATGRLQPPSGEAS